MNIMIIFLINYLGYVVGPARVEKTIFGAEQITETFEVVNISNDSLRIKVEFEDFEINADAQAVFLPAGSNANSLAPLATVNPEEFYIGPQQIENIRVTFRMPKKLLASEYFSMLLFKSQPIPTQYHPMIAVAGEIGVPVYYVNGEIAQRNAEFEALNIVRDTVVITVRNSGNVHLRIKGEARILELNEALIAKDSIPEFLVFPDRIRNIKVPLTKQVAKGDTCVARIRLDYGSTELIEGERRFIR